MCFDNATLKACKINTSILLGEKSLRSQLVLIFPTANVPRVASPRIVFLWIFLVFFLSVVDKQTKQNKNQKIYTSNGEHRWKIFGGITKVIKSYGGISSVKYHLKGGVSHILPR